MQVDILNIGLGFLEGFALIISPCILPILPIIFAGSLTGNKKRPFGIIIGFVLIFSLFTFFSRKLVQNIGIDLNLIRHVSFVLLLFLGMIMLSTYLTEKFSWLTQRLANIGSSLHSVNNPQGGLFSGIFFGGLVAIIWTPCAGPILAAVIVQSVIQQTNLMSFLTLCAFAFGAAVPMLLIAFFGRELINKLNFLKTHTTLFRKILGVIIILSVGYMFYSEQAVGISNKIDTKNTTNNLSMNLQNGLPTPYPAPAIDGIDAWINSTPIKLDDLKGKVVLIDFWTYSCINCIRTLPYLNNWYHQYHDKGLIIIGVHSPEFDFEKKLDNVKNAAIHDGIKYPVALDNQFVTWQNFHNRYWPAHYLIDKNGYVVYTNFGEGDYDIAENNIRYLLGLNQSTTPTTNNTSSIATIDQTPETYLGYSRAQHFSSPEPTIKNQSAHYTFPEKLEKNNWALQGNWTIMANRIVSMQKDASIEINFSARHVFVVMGNITDKKMVIKLLIKNEKNIITKYIDVNKHSLYEAISFNEPSNGILQIISSSPGLEIYTFTFG